MKLILCDSKDITINTDNDCQVIYTDQAQPCIGCFACWCKKENQCVLKDKQSIKTLFEKANQIIIISKNTYGSISAPIKRLFDRSLSSVQPFFTFRNGLMRHKLKKNHIHKHIEAYFYGPSTDKERKTACNMLLSLCENLGATLTCLRFSPILKAVTV